MAVGVRSGTFALAAPTRPILGDSAPEHPRIVPARLPHRELPRRGDPQPGEPSHPVTFTDLNPFPSPARHTNQAACEPSTGLISASSAFTA